MLDGLALLIVFEAKERQIVASSMVEESKKFITVMGRER